MRGTAGLTFGNGLVESRTYDMRYQLEDWTVGSLISYSHVFDDDQNLTNRIDNMNAGNNRGFGYDEIHRLTGASGPWGMGNWCTGLTYTYDMNGNRQCKGEITPTTNYTYVAGTNRLDTATAIGGASATYTYDSNGNTLGDGTNTYEYNAADRLATVDGGSTATYTYDGDGHRVIKSVGSTTTYYFYDPSGRLLAEAVPGPGRGKDYVYFLDAPIGRIDWSTEQNLGDVLLVTEDDPNVHLDWMSYPPALNSYVVRRKQVVDPGDKTFDGAAVIATLTDPTQTYDDPVLNDGNDYIYRVFREALNESLFFYHTDHLGTPIAMTDELGDFAWRAEQLPFGSLHSLPVSNADNNLRFPGQYADAESGLHQNGFRDYAPHTGRFVKPDPLGLPGGLALYEYVRSNPLSNSDPEGLLPRPSLPGEPNPCKYYKEVCRELGCDYHCNIAPKYCREGGSLLNLFDNEATKSCVRLCLQEKDGLELVRPFGCSPCFTCSPPRERCLNERCITSYHRTCFVNCNATSRYWWPGIFPGPGILFPGEGC